MSQAIARTHTSDLILDVERARDILRSSNDLNQIASIRDAAKLAVEYRRITGAGLEAENDAREIVLRAQARLGEFLAENPRAEGRPKKNRGDQHGFVTADLGIDRHEAKRCEKLASLGEYGLEAHIATVRAKGEKLTTSGAIAATSDAEGYDGDEWYTPAEYIEAAREVLGEIDLDPCSNAHAQKTVRAKRFYTKDDDARTKRWSGRVFMNPPYSHPVVAELTAKFIDHVEAGDVTGIVLVNNCTDAKWCQSLLARYSACFTAGRVPFERTDGKRFATRQGQIFFGARVDRDLFAQRFASIGTVMEARG